MKTIRRKLDRKKLDSREGLLYSNDEGANHSHTHGVALILSKEVRKAIIGSEFHEPRITKAYFETKKEKSQ